MMQNPDDFKSGGNANFMSGLVSGQRAQQAQPFIDMAQQQMSQQTQTGEQTLQEFLSQQGQDTRKAERQKTIDEGDIFHQTMQDKVLKSHEEARLAPFLTDKQKEEAILARDVARHQQHAQPVMYMSGVANKLINLPEDQRPAAYETQLAASGYNKDLLPAGMQKWTEPSKDDPGTMSHLAQARYSQIHSPQHEQDIEKVQEQAKGPLAQTRETVAGQKAVEQQKIDAGVYGDVGRQRGVIDKALRSGINPDTQKPFQPGEREYFKDSWRRANAKEMDDYVNKQTDMARLGHFMGQMNPDPKAQQAASEAYQNAIKQAEDTWMRRNGITKDDLPPLPDAPKGKSIKIGGVDYENIGTNPDGSIKIRDPKTGRTGRYKE